ncbi:unnamed protein product [Notodromas monacha]|uniref:Uncharacterized protein n=1 Tax=Notodromas monacha TaxID=399045 RepID=A0A7R9BNI7_9CRUS|nr:unnamed protein product [Notodromas monacha]CAG0918453.1 unnamed protein product [Notodromas monacha]
MAPAEKLSVNLKKRSHFKWWCVILCGRLHKKINFGIRTYHQQHARKQQVENNNASSSSSSSRK